jgi:phosphatidylglycerophosphate synthase
MNLPRHQPLTAPAAHGYAAGSAGLTALQRSAARDLVVTAVALALVGTAASVTGGLGADYPLKGLLFYVLGAWLVWRALGRGTHPHPRFGPANRVTLVRLALVALLAALVGEAVPQPPLASMPAAWLIVVAATLTALLDAADGPLARRSGQSSEFGARFDMETDAAFTLVLCVLVLQAGQAGPWVLAAGLMRYAFVVAARGLPWLAGALPPSRRRQTMCVVQITTLIVCLGPIVPPSVAAALAAVSVALLAVSFAIDIRTLARARRSIQET